MSGQISDEILYTWCHLASGHSQNKLTPITTTIAQTSWFFPYLSLVLRPFPSLYNFLHSTLV